MTELAVLIPVVQTDLALNLLDMIDANSRPPDRIAIIDNSKDGLVLRNPSRVPIVIFRPVEPWGYNRSITQGRAIVNGVDAVSILNDDIIINRYFFAAMLEGLKEDKRIGVVCPNTILDAKQMREVTRQEWQAPMLEGMDRREGWAFTIRKTLWDTIPPIPEDLIHFFGDDWIWYWTHQRKMRWTKVINHCIFHYLGRSVGAKRVRYELEKERAIFLRWIRDGHST